MTFPNGLRSLNHPDFRRFFLAQFVALVCGWMHTEAPSWLVLQLPDSPLRLGLIGTLQFGPILLFSVVTGAVADRLPKRRVLVTTQLALAVLALVLASLGAAGRRALVAGGAGGGAGRPGPDVRLPGPPVVHDRDGRQGRSGQRRRPE